MKKKIHVVFTGGGTGGHLFPGLAVAQKLVERLSRVRITFAGGGKEFERRHVAAAGFEYFAVPCRPMPKRAREAFSFVMENVAGYLASRRFLHDAHVHAVVGLGGYASVPMGRAASRRGVPLVLLEQNAIVGKANRWLSRSANLMCTSFETTEPEAKLKCIVRATGNPMRRRTDCSRTDSFGEVAAPHGALSSALSSASSSGSTSEGQSPRLLVLGGSGGARSLNENVPRALYKIRESLVGWRILHQSGEADVESTRELYRKFAIDAQVEAFWPDLPNVISESSLAVCRAGGTTLAELAACGVPAVLLPYPHAANNHQRINADVYGAAGASLLVDEREVVGRLDDALAEAISGIVDDAPRLAQMSAAMGQLARPAATSQVASLIWSLISGEARRTRAISVA